MNETLREIYLHTAAPVLTRLTEAGFEAYLVGGCVREALRQDLVPEPAAAGEAIAQDLVAATGEAAAQRAACEQTTARDRAAGNTDIDITTNALPEEICACFRDLPVIRTGIRHGTVTVILPGNLPIEITTYRVDGSYSDGRHPDQVRFVRCLQEDLARRDFTVNAMAMDRDGCIQDPFGGQTDLRQGVIRAVGDPVRRFTEDGLRIMRALRFASVLGYTIEPETEAALFTCKSLLKGISAERILTEFQKLVCGQAAVEILRRYVDVLAPVFPELAAMKGFPQNNPYHKYDVLEHCLHALAAVRTRPENEGYMKLTALFHDVGKPRTYSEDEQGIGHFYGHPQAGSRIARDMLQRLKADRFTTDRICTLIHYHDLVFQEDEKLLKRWMNRHTPEVLLEILEIKRADNIGTGNVSHDLLTKFDHIEAKIRDILADHACFSLADLAINGRDLLAAGFPEGPKIGSVLRLLLARVIDGDLPNDREALLQAAREYLPAEG